MLIFVSCNINIFLNANKHMFNCEFDVLKASFHVSNIFLLCIKLAVECGVGIAVFVRCFTDKTAIEEEIGEKLGYGLSRAPFAVIIVSVNLLLI